VERHALGDCAAVPIDEAVDHDGPVTGRRKLPHAMASDIARSPDHKDVHSREAFIAFVALLASDFLLTRE
jgi:hypothetical protein